MCGAARIKERRYAMQLQVSTLSQIPIYEQIKQQIKEQVFSGSLKAGDKLPSIRLLAKELQIGVITSKRAYDDLCEEGILVSHPGKGVFVAEINKEAAKTTHLQIIREQLEDTVRQAKQFSIGKEDFKNLVDEIYREEDDNERN